MYVIIIIISSFLFCLGGAGVLVMIVVIGTGGFSTRDWRVLHKGLEGFQIDLEVSPN